VTGAARVVQCAPKVALALGYDVDAALERHNPEALHVDFRRPRASSRYRRRCSAQPLQTTPRDAPTEPRRPQFRLLNATTRSRPPSAHTPRPRTPEPQLFFFVFLLSS
jgi:hypothetical protein